MLLNRSLSNSSNAYLRVKKPLPCSSPSFQVTHYLMSLPSASDNAMASRVGSETPTSSILSASEGGATHEAKFAPIFLPVGAAVSAKYRGAFCEALIERVDLNYRIRVQLKKKKVWKPTMSSPLFSQFCCFWVKLTTLLFRNFVSKSGSKIVTSLFYNLDF